MSNQYTPKQIADFIVKYANDQEVKKELKKQGYNIVPNSLSKLIQNLEKAGFSVTRKTENVSKKNNEFYDKEAIQIFGAKPITQKETKPEPTSQESQTKPETSILNNADVNKKNKLNSGEEEKRILDPFGEGFLDKENVTKNTNSTPQQSEPTSVKNETSEKKATVFNHYSKPEEEPEDPKEKIWHRIKKNGKLNESISFYSLIVNAQLVDLSDDKIILGFGTAHTYQMNQLKKENNMKVLDKLVTNIVGKQLAIELQVISGKKNTTNISQNVDERPENEVDSIQIFGGRK